MRNWRYWDTMYLFLIFVGILIVNDAIAQTAMPMTPLEKKLYEAAKIEGKLVIWESGSLKEMSQFFKAFNNKYPGIEISYWEATDEQVDERYFDERRAGRKSVDEMKISAYARFKREGVLADLSDIIQDVNFPRDFATKDLDNVSIEHTIKAVAYNTKLISPKEVPRSWEDLLHPRWKGKIAVETVMDYFTHLTKPWGMEKTLNYLNKLKEQNPVFVLGVTQIMTLLGAGEFQIAAEAHLHRALLLQEKGLTIAIAPISPFINKTTNYVSVRDAPHPNAAKLYLRWLMSAEGQAMVDKVRMKGNPLPGSGTNQSKAVEKLGVTTIPVSLWDTDINQVQGLCRKAVGYTK